MNSKQVIDAVRSGTISKVEENPHYAIYDCVVKEYPEVTCLVQSSREPINLGREMLPLMNTRNLWEFIDEHHIPRMDDSPVEVYLYNWTGRAQGPMVFDVGVVVDNDIDNVANDAGFILKRYPAMKFASIIYHGPFPHEPMSGWGHIQWERRAKDKGLVYTEQLYRELYHLYDFEKKRHITEVQIEVE